MPIPDKQECFSRVVRASRKKHPSDRPVEHRVQTENKLDILANYFGAWPNTILSGLRRFRPRSTVHLWVVDLFAGRGWHESEKWEEGRRPGTAAAAAFRLMQSVTRDDWPFDVFGHLIAVDADAEFEQTLHSELDRFQRANMEVRIIPENCAEVVPEIRDLSRGGYSLWLFDPYGLDSIPFCLFEPLFGDSKTEVIINLDAGDAQRVIDQAAGSRGTYDLRAVPSTTFDCLFGGDAWRDLPQTLPGTPARTKWLADAYAGLFAPWFPERQALPLASKSGFTRYLVQLAAHPSATRRFRQSYDEVQKPFKKLRDRPKVEDRARQLAKNAAGLELTPRLIFGLGLFPGESLVRLESFCQHALALGLASRCDPGPDGTVAFLPLKEQPVRTRGFFAD